MLSEKIREVLRLKHYSLRTEEAYLGWVRRCIRFHHGKNPCERGENAVREFSFEQFQKFCSRRMGLMWPKGAAASWTAAALCRFSTARLARPKRQRTAALQNLAEFSAAFKTRPQVW